MASKGNKTELLRQLIPKSYHFDGYSEVNCPNPRDKPFFADNVIPMGEHYLTTTMLDRDTIRIELQSTCNFGLFTFLPYNLPIELFAKKLQEATKKNQDFITLEIKPKYKSYNECNPKKRCRFSNKHCMYLKNNHPSTVYAAVSFNFSEMKEALAMYFEITGGKSTMAKRKNKFFGMNFEFGISKDSNIASTLMGISVRNPATNNWYVFDIKNLTRKNIANMKMGDFPVIYVPANQYVVGKLYKIDNQYFYVKSINPNGTVTLINGADGVIREVIPEESLIPGFNFVTEVVAFDAANMMNPSSGENVGSNILAAMFMMQWSKGSDDNAEFSLDNITDDSFNGLGSYLPILLASGNMGNLGNMFSGTDGSPNIAMLMALGSGDSENSELTQMLLLSHLLGGGNNTGKTAVNNPFSGIFPNIQTPAVPTNSDTANVICDTCGSIYVSGTYFCPKCGGKTRELSKTCTKCGAVLMDGAEFCHKCGAKVGFSTCAKCGTQLTDDTNFCPKCGNPVNSVVAPEPAVLEASTDDTAST